MRKFGSKSLYDYAITVGTRGFGRLFALIITIIIARSLGTEDFGMYSLFFGIFIVIVQAEAGVNIAHVRFSKLGVASKAIVLRLSLLSQTFIVLFLTIIGWPLSLLLAQTIGIESLSVPYIGFVASGLLGLFGIWFGIFQADGKFARLGIFSLLFNLILMAYIGGAYILDIKQDLTDVLYSYLIISMALGFVSLIILWNQSSPTNDNKLMRDYYKMIVMNMFVTMFYFLYRYIDVYFLKYYADLATVGIYSAAMKTSMILNILTGSLTTILLPKAVEAITSKDKIKTYVKKSYALSALISVCFIIFYFLSPFILPLLFGEEYSEASNILQWLVVGWIVNTLYIPVSQVFYALNKVAWRIAIEFIKLIFAVLFFIILIPEYGALGAAYALLISISITLLIASVIATILTRNHLREIKTFN
ncbi:MAG: oligosaccharide flippase family protein [Gammaproteobacteria bacterium]|nr:oligosaccharide flippase family protein [Gammaproteobacteria bacterium]